MVLSRQGDFLRFVSTEEAEDSLFIGDCALQGRVAVRVGGTSETCSVLLQSGCSLLIPHFFLALRSWAQTIYSTHYSFLDVPRKASLLPLMVLNDHDLFSSGRRSLTPAGDGAADICHPQTASLLLHTAASWWGLR